MQRFWGKYRATVVEINDPEYRGRIRVTCPLVYGKLKNTDSLVKSPWVLPCFPYSGSQNMGGFAIPPVDSCVWIEFEQGDPDKPIWVGSWIKAPAATGTHAPREAVADEGASGTGAGDDAPTPQTGGPNKDIPTNTVWRTPGGHVIEVDDTEGQLKVKITDSGGQFILLRPEDGKGGGPKILIKGANGQYIWISGKSGENKIEIKDKSGNYVLLDAEDNSVRLEDVAGDYINLKAGIVDIIANTDVNVRARGSTIRLDAPGGLVKVTAKGGNVDVDAETVSVDAASVTVDAGSIVLAGKSGGAAKIARVGDKVWVQSGSSEGLWEIVEGSSVVRCGG